MNDIEKIKSLQDLDLFLNFDIDLKYIFNLNSFRIVNFSHVIGAKRIFIEYDIDFYRWALDKKYINNNFILCFNDSTGLCIFKDMMQDIQKEYQDYIFKVYNDLQKNLKVNKKIEKKKIKL